MPQIIERFSFEGNNMLIKSAGRKYRVRTDQISARLARADLTTRESARLSPDGATITWPKLQLEMSVSGLMQMCQVAF